MKRITRTTLAAVAAVAATIAGIAVPGTASASPAPSIYVDGAEYRYADTVQIGDGIDSNDIRVDSVDGVVDTLLDLAKPVSCVPKSKTTTIHQPHAYVYYGAIDSIYVWEGLAEAAITGCPNNDVTIRVRLRDQSLDGTSMPAEGAIATGTGKARAGAVAEVMQRYNNVVMATGLKLHTLTALVAASQTDGRTTTVWCSTKSWTYIATLAGPQFVGETPTENVKCA